jgi:hypothetical protein
LCGVRTNRQAVGVRVTVRAGELVQVDEVHSGRGYQSHWGGTLHFGLGSHRRADRLEVRWTDGTVQVFQDVDADRRVLICEGWPDASYDPGPTDGRARGAGR